FISRQRDSRVGANEPPWCYRPVIPDVESKACTALQSTQRRAFEHRIPLCPVAIQFRFARLIHALQLLAVSAHLRRSKSCASAERPGVAQVVSPPSFTDL